MNADRLIELETKLAFQEDTLQILNEVVTRQQQQIERLEAQLALLIDRFRQLSDPPTGNLKPADEKPPHY